MITFEKDGKRFNYRIAGVSIVDGKVLLHRLEKDDFWALPVGRCEFLESSKDALYREYLEETSSEVNVGDPIWILEMFFNHEGERFHELSFIYEITFPSNSICLQSDVFYGNEGHQKIIFQWVPLDGLERIKLYPTFLRNRLLDMPKCLEHIVHYDN